MIQHRYLTTATISC